MRYCSSAGGAHAAHYAQAELEVQGRLQVSLSRILVNGTHHACIEYPKLGLNAFFNIGLAQCHEEFGAVAEDSPGTPQLKLPASKEPISIPGTTLKCFHAAGVAVIAVVGNAAVAGRCAVDDNVAILIGADQFNGLAELLGP